jgi:hypothetical protein
MFEFKRVGGKAAKTGFGSYHGIEMPYVFGTLSELGSFNDDDANVSKQVMGYWTTFARTGNPNGRNGKWPRFDRATRSYLQIDVASVPKTQFHTARLDALLNLRAPGSAKPKRRDGDRRGGGRSKPARPRERARRCPGAEGSTRRLPDARTIP